MFSFTFRQRHGIISVWPAAPEKHGTKSDSGGPMDIVELKCSKCGTRYRMPRRPVRGKLRCRKCGAGLKPAQPAGQLDRTGTTLAGYTLLERLSAGKHAHVYRAEQVSMHRTVAVKVLADQLAADQETVARFLESARRVAAVHHPNIVRIYDVEAAECPFFSMEYIEGATIRRLLDTAGLPPPADALRMAVAVGEAIAQASRNHSTDIRVDTDTVMLTSSGVPKILPSAFTASSGAQEDGEQRSVIQFGRFLYAMLTGIEPSPDAADAEPPSNHNADVSDTLDDTVLQMLRGKEEGFGTLAAATEALKQLSADAGTVDQHVEAAPDHVHERKPRHWKRTVVGVAAFAACAAAVVMAIFIQSQKQQVRGRLDEVRRYAADEMHSATIEAGKRFLEDYPLHQSAEEIRAYVAQAAAKERLASLRKAIYDVLALAEEAPHMIEHHQSLLDGITESFADIKGAGIRFVAPNKKRIEAIWRRQWRVLLKNSLPWERTKDGPDIDRILSKMKAQCAEPGVVGADKALERAEALRAVLDRIMLDKFAKINNRAFYLDQNGETEEAIKLYQDVIEKWGPDAKPGLSEKTFAQLAREAIEKLRASKP